MGVVHATGAIASPSNTTFSQISIAKKVADKATPSQGTTCPSYPAYCAQGEKNSGTVPRPVHCVVHRSQGATHTHPHPGCHTLTHIQGAGAAGRATDTTGRAGDVAGRATGCRRGSRSPRECNIFQRSFLFKLIFYSSSFLHCPNPLCTS